MILINRHRSSKGPKVVKIQGPNTTTTIIFQKSFASHATPKRHFMAHQRKNLCGFSVFHCVEGAFGASFGGTPKMKNGAHEMNSKMVVVVVGPSLIVKIKDRPPGLKFSSEIANFKQAAHRTLFLLVGNSEKVKIENFKRD